MRRPQIKPEHRAHRLADGRIRIGGPCFGTASEIEDPTGVVWSLVVAMDGTRTTEEIVEGVASHYSEELPSSVRALMDQLVGAGFVDDAGRRIPRA